MTISVAIRIPTSIIFASDSKLTTSGLLRVENQKAIWEKQTFDHATKVARDRGERLMAMVAGPANIGAITATDFIAMSEFPACSTDESQDEALAELLDSMCKTKREFWTSLQVEPEDWPGPKLILAIAPTTGFTPRTFHVDLGGEKYTLSPVLNDPGLLFEGACDDALALTYGFRFEFFNYLSAKLNVPVQDLRQALVDSNYVRPLDRMNFIGMPLQDAIDLAAFLASVQIEMDRFRPGHPACGGAIDVMVLRTTPQPGILFMPGKELVHPVHRQRR